MTLTNHLKYGHFVGYTSNYGQNEGNFLNKFTLKLHNNGWLVVDLLNYWSISRSTYERYTAKPERHEKLNKMIAAMGDRNPGAEDLIREGEE